MAFPKESFKLLDVFFLSFPCIDENFFGQTRWIFDVLLIKSLKEIFFNLPIALVARSSISTLVACGRLPSLLVSHGCFSHSWVRTATLRKPPLLFCVSCW